MREKPWHGSLQMRSKRVGEEVPDNCGSREPCRCRECQLLTPSSGWEAWEPAGIQGQHQFHSRSWAHWPEAGGPSVHSQLTRLPQWLLTEQTPRLDLPELFGRISIAWWLRAWSLYLCKSGFKSKLFIYSIQPWTSYLFEP